VRLELSERLDDSERECSEPLEDSMLCPDSEVETLEAMEDAIEAMLSLLRDLVALDSLSAEAMEAARDALCELRRAEEDSAAAELPEPDSWREDSEFSTADETAEATEETSEAMLEELRCLVSEEWEISEAMEPASDSDTSDFELPEEPESELDTAEAMLEERADTALELRLLAAELSLMAELMVCESEPEDSGELLAEC